MLDYVYVSLFCVLCVFEINCDPSSPNKDIMRFTCQSGEVVNPFAHVFVKIFPFFV